MRRPEGDFELRPDTTVVVHVVAGHQRADLDQSETKAVDAHNQTEQRGLIRQRIAAVAKCGNTALSNCDRAGRKLPDSGDAPSERSGETGVVDSVSASGSAVTGVLEQAAPVTRSATADEGSPLLGSKFAVPEPPRFMVARGRLVERLTRAVREPVTVVTGPAGSGKTQAVAAWTRAGCATDTVAWIMLEEGDSQPTAFWTYVVAALRRAGLPLFPTLADPVPPTAVDQEFLVRLAAQLASQPRSVLLILDEVPTLTEWQWANELDFVLRHSESRLRLVLVGRWDPPLPLYRYRLAGRLSELRADDLAFTEAETAELLALHGIELTPQGLASLMRQTEGWAAGLRLFAMALEGHDNAETVLATISGDEATIAEYFVREVLRAQPADVRDFLLKTSILDTVTPELAQVLTGRTDGRRVMALLARENVFVQTVTGHPAAYRYHRLFGELLRAELSYDDPDRIPQLHRQAARWLAADGQTVDAVAHAVRADDWATAAVIAIGDYAVGRLVLRGTADPLGAMFHDLPDLVDSTESAMVAAALAFADADPDRCAKHLSRAGEMTAGRTVDGGTALTLTSALLDALLASVSRDAPRMLDSARAADALLTEVPAARLERHPELRALVLAVTGTAQSWMGAIDDATVTLTEAVAAATAPLCESLKVDCLEHLALLEAYRGRLRHTAALASQAIDTAKRCDAGARRLAGAQVARAWVAVEHYDVEMGWRYLRAAEPTRGPVPGGLSEAAFAVVKSRLLRARGEFRGALKLLQEAGGSPGVRSQPEWLEREIMLGQARILIASGHAREALAAVRQLADHDRADSAVVLAEALLAEGDADQAERVVRRVVEGTGIAVPVSVHAWLMLAWAAADNGDVRDAQDALRHALRLANPESQRRHFHEVGARLRRLMRDDQEIAGEYRALGRCTGTPQAQPGPPATEPLIVEKLSKREMEVLRYVEAMFPTEEIASAMYVSINTVKTHVRSILRKLSASRRNEAVRRARELGLI